MPKATGVAGSTVIAFKYRDGIIMGSDTAVFYGGISMPNVPKLFRLTDRCLVGFSGRLSDIQSIYDEITDKIQRDPREIDPQGIHKLLQNILYEARSSLKLLELSVVVCGINKKASPVFLTETDEQGRILGVVNSKGNFWFDSAVATGIASHLILPVLREQDTADMDGEGARALMERCLRILCYKDCRASNIVQIALCGEGGVAIEEPYPLSTSWEIGHKPGETLLQ